MASIDLAKGFFVPFAYESFDECPISFGIEAAVVHAFMSEKSRTKGCTKESALFLHDSAPVEIPHEKVAALMWNANRWLFATDNASKKVTN